jgi:hypothetical protein
MVLRSQSPLEPSDWEFKDGLDECLELGEYFPYQTHVMSTKYMMKLAALKYIHNQPDTINQFVNRTKTYLKHWTNCLYGHQSDIGTSCYQEDFQSLMNVSMEFMDSTLQTISEYDKKDYSDFDKVLDITKMWNDLQKSIRETFYAHLTDYPKWLGFNDANQARRSNCAQCNVFDALGPPQSTFIALSGFFMPYETQMPDGDIVPEGVILHERAGKYHEIHEHAHAYLHEKKSNKKQHFHCEWIDEGISDWAAINILKSEMIEKSHFMELYDFWLVFNSLDDANRKKIIWCWCQDPETLNWWLFISDMLLKIQEFRSTNRALLTWRPSDKIDIKFTLDEYIK